MTETVNDAETPADDQPSPSSATLTPAESLDLLSDDLVALLANLAGATRGEIQTSLQLASFGDRAGLFAAGMVVDGPRMDASHRRIIVTDHCLKVIAEAAAQRRRWVRAQALEQQQDVQHVVVEDGTGRRRVLPQPVAPVRRFDGPVDIRRRDGAFKVMGRASADNDVTGSPVGASRVRLFDAPDGSGCVRLELELIGSEASDFIAAAEAADEVDFQLKVADAGHPAPA